MKQVMELRITGHLCGLCPLDEWPVPVRATRRPVRRKYKPRPKPRVPRPRSTWSQARERRRAREATAPGHATPEQLAARWAYYGGRCWMCRGPATSMDHIKPLAKGGANWPSNQRPACWPCNARKSTCWPWPTGRLPSPAAEDHGGREDGSDNQDTVHEHDKDPA